MKIEWDWNIVAMKNKIKETTLVLASIYPYSYKTLYPYVRSCYNIYTKNPLEKAVDFLDFALEANISLDDSFNIQYEVDIMILCRV
jgi:hypothetical protein